jgi:L-iditol 2-dehydrogenase
MQACVLTNVNRLILKEVEKPVPGENEVLLKIKACGICSSDIPRVFQGQVYHFPIVLGHEFSGIIESVGSNIEKNYVGKRAVGFPLIPCGKCPSCAVGAYNRCDKYDYFGSRRDGGFQEYLVVPFWNIVLCPDTIEYKHSAMCEPAAVALHALNASGAKMGDSIAIVGSGTIGILLAKWAKISGIQTIFMVGTSNKKSRLIENLGFTYITNKEINSNNFDVVFECVGSSQALGICLRLVGKKGRVVVVGNPNADIMLEKDIYWKILRNELTITGVWNSTYNSNNNEWKTVLNYMESGLLNVEDLITHTFPLPQCNEAFAMIAGKKELTIKVMITNE